MRRYPLPTRRLLPTSISRAVKIIKARALKSDFAWDGLLQGLKSMDASQRTKALVVLDFIGKGDHQVQLDPDIRLSDTNRSSGKASPSSSCQTLPGGRIVFGPCCLPHQSGPRFTSSFDCRKSSFRISGPCYRIARVNPFLEPTTKHVQSIGCRSGE